MRARIAPVALACAAVVAASAGPLAAPTSAQAGSDAARIAEAVRREVVYVHPRARPTLTQRQAGRLRLRILRRRIGRIKVAVLPRRIADRASGIDPLSHAIDRELRTPGTLLVSAGNSLFAITSYRGADAAVAALRRAADTNRSLYAQLADAVDRIAKIDPGPSEDLANQQPGQVPNVVVPSPGDADDLIDDVVDPFKHAFYLLMAAVALPFVVIALLIVLRVRRHRTDASEMLGDARVTAREDLVALGDDVRALDIDSSMPGADPVALAEYEAALRAYERADKELSGAETPRTLRRARAALDEGRRRIDAARARFGTMTAPARPAAPDADAPAPPKGPAASAAQREEINRALGRSPDD